MAGATISKLFLFGIYFVLLLLAPGLSIFRIHYVWDFSDFFNLVQGVSGVYCNFVHILLNIMVDFFFAFADGSKIFYLIVCFLEDLNLLK